MSSLRSAIASIACLMIARVPPSRAQSWNAQLQIGTLSNSTSSEGGRYQHQAPPSWFCSIGGAYGYRHWEYGLRLGFHRYAYLQQGVYVIGYDSASQKNITAAFSEVEALPALSLFPHIQYHTSSGPLTAYIGASIGFSYFFPTRGYLVGNKRYYTYERGGGGICYEAQLGASCALTRRLSMFIELAYGTDNIPDRYSGVHFEIASASLGLKHTLPARPIKKMAP